MWNNSRQRCSSQTQEQLDERSRYTEDMLTKTLAAIKATAEG